MFNTKFFLISGSIVTIVANLYSFEIKELISSNYNKFFNNHKIIKVINLQYIDSIDKEIMQFNKNVNHLVLDADKITPHYGNYNLNDEKIGKIRLIKDNEGYTISVSKNISIDEIIEYCNSTHSKYYGIDNYTTFYTINGKQWAFSGVSPRELLSNITESDLISTKPILKVMDYINNFRNNNLKRIGFLFYSTPRKGKSLTVQIIAAEFNMPIYTLYLNATKMSDCDINNLIIDVPPNSILLLEELDLQIETMQKNSDNHVSIGGLLNAMDGVKRRNEGNIMIITTNNYEKLKEIFPEGALVGPGRVDHVINFDE